MIKSEVTLSPEIAERRVSLEPPDEPAWTGVQVWRISCFRRRGWRGWRVHLARRKRRERQALREDA
jgi:hypothetical protein